VQHIPQKDLNERENNSEYRQNVQAIKPNHHFQVHHFLQTANIRQSAQSHIASTLLGPTP